MLAIKKYTQSSEAAVFFESIKERDFAFFLDSSKRHERFGRYSYVGFDPLLTYQVKGNEVLIREEGKALYSTENAFDALNRLYLKYARAYEAPYPFVGGFVGYLGYDLCHHVEVLPKTAQDKVDIPDAFLGLYDGIVIFDHEKKETIIAALGLKKDAETRIMEIETLIRDAKEMTPWCENAACMAIPSVSKDKYVEGVQAVRDYIKNGDVYQVNYTQHFKVPLSVTPWDLYKKLRSVNPAPFSSYLNFGEGTLASSSPERFIKIENRKIETRPIKGTMPRYADDMERDLATRERLLNSEKDQSELLMIVDLERNDIGKVAKVGTVTVPELFCLETYETVHHLVATVRGELDDSQSVIDCLKATFPGGSITGAPKIKAMEVIDTLEPVCRNVYTGSIGYLGLNGDVDLNIVIRTLVIKDNQAYFGVGGGVVWDSDPLSEYEESLTKARALLKALNASVGDSHEGF